MPKRKMASTQETNTSSSTDPEKLSKLQKQVEMKNQVSLVSTTGQPLSFSLVSQKKATKCDHDHLMDLANTISSADSHIKSATTGKLKQIHDQIKVLQQQALKCLEDAKRDQMLHQAACNVKKRPGSMYYLYEKNSDKKEPEQYFSIMSPEDWGTSCPHKFLGAYKLDYNMQFVPQEELKETMAQNSFIEDVYNKAMAGASNSIEWKI